DWRSDTLTTGITRLVEVLSMSRGKMKNRIALACIVFLFAQNLLAMPDLYLPALLCSAELQGDRVSDDSNEATLAVQQSSLSSPSLRLSQDPGLVPPVMLKWNALEAG